MHLVHSEAEWTQGSRRIGLIGILSTFISANKNRHSNCIYEFLQIDGETYEDDEKNVSYGSKITFFNS